MANFFLHDLTGEMSSGMLNFVFGLRTILFNSGLSIFDRFFVTAIRNDLNDKLCR